jgi:hypothetical protein
MATVQSSLSATYGPTFGFGPSRQIITLPAIVAVATTNIDNANDDFGLVWAPKGFVVTGAAFNATDMDSGTALVWDVGDTADEDRLFAAITTGQSAGTSVALAATGFLYKYTARTLITAYCNTAAGTPVAGTLKFWVQGFVDEEYSTTALTLA